MGEGREWRGYCSHGRCRGVAEGGLAVRVCKEGRKALFSSFDAGFVVAGRDPFARGDGDTDWTDKDFDRGALSEAREHSCDVM